MHKNNRKSGYRQKGNMLPGTPVYTGTMDIVPEMLYIHYDDNRCIVKNFRHLSDFSPETGAGKHWLHVCGLSRADQIATLGHKLSLHPLLIEDVLNTDNQPKIVEFENCVLVILKHFDSTTDELPVPEQVSMVLTQNYVLSFQENDRYLFEQIRSALEENTGRTRTKGSDYLLSLLIDHIVDSYLPEIDKMEELLLDTEDRVLEEAGKVDIREMIVCNRKRYQVLKKAIIPLKESFSRLTRLDNKLIEKSTLAYLHDIYDHIDFVARSVDSFHEALFGVMNLYTSSNDLKMNITMQRLTKVATVFIPLTFLAGVWGMNFELMPELDWKYGYLVSWGVFLAIGVTVWLYLKKKMY